MSMLAVLARLIHRQFLWFLLGSYALAGFFPGPGLWIKSITLGEIRFLHETTQVTLPMVMLALLLWNAALGVQPSERHKLGRESLLLAAGLLGNLLIPLAFIFGVSRLLWFWHNPDEVQNLLLGLALVASMPIAGSSTAWAQNANGSMALSLGLVLGSTFLSPLTTPLALHLVGFVATGDYAEDLHELAAGGTGAFLAVSVLLPSLLGMLTRAAAGPERIARARPVLKLSNLVNLLLLNYSNASVSLPQTVADPDWDFLLAIASVVLALCITAFASGWLLGRILHADPRQRTSLMFGLGMNNNGTGLVLASLALADHPNVLLPIIFYNLIQHLAAGSVDYVLSRRSVRSD